MKNRFLVIVKEGNSKEDVDSYKTLKEAEEKVKLLYKNKENILNADLNENYKDHFRYLEWEIVDLGA